MWGVTVGGVVYCSRCINWNCVHALCYCYFNLKPVKLCTTDTTTYVCLLWTILLLNVLKKVWCQLPEDGKINKAYICMSYVKDSMHKLQNSVFVGVTSAFHFVIMHRIHTAKVTSQDSQNTGQE